ncbi:MAG: hypothetical protein ACSHX0_00290 [Akkermansiaceae bacterium]
MPKEPSQLEEAPKQSVASKSAKNTEAKDKPALIGEKAETGSQPAKAAKKAPRASKKSAKKKVASRQADNVELAKETPNKESSSKPEMNKSEEVKTGGSPKEVSQQDQDGDSGRKQPRRGRGRNRNNRQDQPQQESKQLSLNHNQIAKRAWKIFLGEVCEEGLALIADKDAVELAKRSLRIAEIYTLEEAKINQKKSEPNRSQQNKKHARQDQPNRNMQASDKVVDAENQDSPSKATSENLADKPASKPAEKSSD